MILCETILAIDILSPLPPSTPYKLGKYAYNLNF